ncbi:MAG: SDR family oxidoreductase [Alphaproteobacteria bacterium]|nr:SDR family oxidoreductase [Alphaproteobacteria bacterium]MDI9329881.1 SDR family oxidoreductase [Alphaproteobacteria bacterium]
MSNWVWVSGGAYRLGREISQAFARAGWSVAVHCHQSKAAAAEVAKQCRALGVSSCVVQADLGDAAATTVMCEELSRDLGTDLRCVVNNASLFLPDAAHDFDDAQALAQWQVNLMAPMRMGRWLAALHAGGGSGSASLVHLLDQKVFNLNPAYFSYTLSKLALHQAVALQAQALAPTLRVNAVAPGLLYLSGPQSPENFQAASRVNLLRQPIDPAQVAQSVLFLAQNPAISGASLQVDNGQHLVGMDRDVMNVPLETLRKYQP